MAGRSVRQFAMPSQDLRTNAQKMTDTAEHHRVEMWRAARTVRFNVPDPAARQEVLACLGLLDLQQSP